MDVMKRADRRYYLLSQTNNNPLFLLSYLQTLICNELLFLSSFFFQPLKKVCFQTEYWANLLKNIYFCLILFFTSSSPGRRDQFPVSYFSVSRGGRVFYATPPCKLTFSSLNCQELFSIFSTVLSDINWSIRNFASASLRPPPLVIIRKELSSSERKEVNVQTQK